VGTPNSPSPEIVGWDGVGDWLLWVKVREAFFSAFDILISQMTKLPMNLFGFEFVNQYD
jgi:hypothetical protein